ncbi:MAG: penicillin-binding transpeptidase domain-containing protein, partial [Nevskia sp.]|uniref:penicillin-binding transpeptidase domain-containing protein n=1 Tax=Nevskia sp. TaxID=1929292 RepID=UPI00403748CB
MIRPVHACLGVLVTVLLAACGDRHPAAGTAADPFPSTYRPAPAATVLIRGATVLTGLDSRLDNTDVLLSEGRIAAIGKGLAAGGTTVIEAGGRYLTPGIIDVHSHLGVYPAPAVWATSDGNEATAATTPEVWAEHSIWPQDPGFEAARAGGVTTLQVLPGSANLIGGRGVVIKNVPAVTYQQMLFPGARRSLKMACGENPKRVYGKGGGRSPSTGMGNVAGYRAAFAKASGYRARWDAWNKERKGPSPDRDLAMDTLADVLRGNILVHMHCYRADQMATMLDVAKEFGVTDHMGAYLPMALGAGETTLLRMTMAYAMLANGALEITPSLVDRVQDRNGKTVYRHEPRTCRGCGEAAAGSATPAAPELVDPRKPFHDPASVYQVVSMMQGVTTRGTAGRLAALGRPIAGKTGTTNDAHDNWFLGSTPDITIGVYIG